MNLLAASKAEHAEIASIQSKNGLNRFPVCQVHERRIGELNAQVLIFFENSGDFGNVRLSQREEFEWPAAQKK
jgi:hypothetical protein